MRRIVVMAMSNAGVLCAKQIKKYCPQDEVNLLISEAGLTDFEKSAYPAVQSAIIKRQGPPFPDTTALTALGLDVIATQQVQLDIGTREVGIITGRGSLTIKYSDIVIEVQANSRLPRPLHHKSNVFPLPSPGFGQNSHGLAEALGNAKRAGLPALVVGSGMPALDAILLAREAGLQVTWLETPSDTSPKLDRHFTDYIVKHFHPHVVHIVSDKPSMENLSFSMDNDQVDRVELPDGNTLSVGVCLWAETFLAMHPILREDGFILDSSGKLALTDERPSEIHIIGSGAAASSATLCQNSILLPQHTGSSEAALLSSLATANLLLENTTPAPGLFGTASASMPGLSLCRTGMTIEEAANLNIPVDHATVSICQTALPDTPADSKGLLSLNLVAHKESRTIIGAQVIGEDYLSLLAEAVLNIVFEGMKNGTVLDDLRLHELSGPAGDLVKDCADRLLDKITLTGVYGITPFEFMASLNAGADFFVLDIRPQNEWRNGHIPLAHNIPVQELKKRLSSEVPRYVPLVVVSDSGTNAFNTACHLSGMGAKDLYVLDGGMRLWTYPLEKEL